ncbi:cell envelope integrity EipB family protein [Roseiarcaceae bacterium H3SJ34-1]|uniref:cell envelope integrity EipB family protein n=1 Tax=Terripilifer ovatus TaxID=3032367 RepID=UPI003AB9417E|nr:cell envelope integrity EipB family protein [Roseiarcaceae bacterium H3SJ34-1]
MARHSFSVFRQIPNCALAAGFLTLAGFPAQAADVRLAAHRAVYDLSFLRGTGSAAPVSAQGRIVYEFTGSACKGYQVSFRQLTEITPSEGEPRLTDTRSLTFESGDGKTLHYRIENLVGGQVASTNEGEATRSGDGSLSIDISKPMPKKSDNDVDAIFPTAQMIRSIAAARDGESTVEMKIYDGSDGGDKIYQTLNIIGHGTKDALNDPTKTTPAMKDMSRWRVTVSYFDMAKSDSNPAYTLSFNMWENGVSSDLVLDYGDFALKGTMTKLDMLPEAPCP